MEGDSPFLPVPAPDLGRLPVGQGPRVVGWLAEVGEAVAAGQRVCEVGVPGLLAAAESPAAGTLVRVNVPDGTEIAPGESLGWVERGGAS